MATTSLWPIHNTGSKGAKAVVKQLVDYAENREKTVNAVRSVMGYVSRDTKVTGPDGGGTVGTSLDSRCGIDTSGAKNDDQAIHMVMNHLFTREQGETDPAVQRERKERRYVTGINCTPERAVEEMMLTKNRWPERGNRLLFHGYQSFAPGEVTPDQAHQIGVQLARELWGDRFEVVVATHLDREHLHSHFIINTVSFLDGRKLNWDREYPRMQKRSDELCRKQNLSVVPDDGNLERKLHRGAVRAEEEYRPTIQSIVKEDVDACIQVASTLEEWMGLMKQKGYLIDDSRKYLRIFPYGHSRCIRLDRRFGEDYSLDGIAAQIARQDMKLERREKTEEEKVREIYRELRGKGRRRGSAGRHPKGIQVYYLCFLYRIGYRKTPAQIARTHYLLREELTKLDRYIEESKFLIHEDISTLEQLKERRSQDQTEMNRLYRSRNNLKRMIPVSDAIERASVQGQIIRIDQSIQKLRKNLRSEKGILKRVGEMEQKEKTVALVQAGQLVAAGLDRAKRNRFTERSQ